MWLVELVLLSVVGGTLLGLGLRVWDEAWEKAKRDAVKSIEKTANKPE